MRLKFEEENLTSGPDRESILRRARRYLEQALHNRQYRLPLRIIGVDASDIAADFEEHHRQRDRLESFGQKELATELIARNWPLKNERLKVLVDVGEVKGKNHLNRVQRVLDRAGLDVSHVPQNEAESLFIDRAAETIALRAISGARTYRFRVNDRWVSGQSAQSVTISSLRTGDDILCANGYFFSTRSVVGQSTCRIKLPANRYSFGVVDKDGSPRMHPELWSVPPTKRIHLRLP
jgi:chorismate mutase